MAGKSLFLLPACSLWRREVVRFLRQRSRVIGALGTPAVFWLLIGSGLGKSFQLPGAETKTNYLEYLFPGTLVLIVLFTAIFSCISVIEDRREGFLQVVLAAPVKRSAMAAGKIFGSTTLALFQAMLFLMLAPLAGLPVSIASLIGTFLVLIVVGLGLSGLGFVTAWPMSSTQGFHAIMNLLLFPLWLLSGALFPAAGASGWLQWVMMINPLRYALATLRHTLYWGAQPVGVGEPSFGVSLAVTVCFAAATFWLSVRMVSRNSRTAM